MYETCDLLVINKMDVIDYFDFDVQKLTESAKMRNPKIDILLISATKNEGIDELADWIVKNTESWNC